MEITLKDETTQDLIHILKRTEKGASLLTFDRSDVLVLGDVSAPVSDEKTERQRTDIKIKAPARGRANVRIPPSPKSNR